MKNLELLEDRLERLSQRQQHLANLLLTTLPPGERQKTLVEKTLVDNEVNQAHRHIAYVQRGYKMRDDA